MIDAKDITRIKNFLYTPDYAVLEKVVNEIISEAQRRSPVSDSEWETVKNALLAEGEQRGCARIMQRLTDYASKAP